MGAGTTTGWRAPPPRWTADRDEQLKRLAADGLTGAAIAERLGGGLTRNVVIARLSRLRGAGEPGALPSKRGLVGSHLDRHRAEIARLADACADGAVTLAAAAITAGLKYDRAFKLWAAIKAELGWQAR